MTPPGISNHEAATDHREEACPRRSPQPRAHPDRGEAASLGGMRSLATGLATVEKREVCVGSGVYGRRTMSKKAKRTTRHHTVPRFHLRGFASADRMLRQIDLQTGDQKEVSIADAAASKDFYTVVLPDGTRSDMWERRLADVEN